MLDIPQIERVRWLKATLALAGVDGVPLGVGSIVSLADKAEGTDNVMRDFSELAAESPDEAAYYVFLLRERKHTRTGGGWTECCPAMPGAVASWGLICFMPDASSIQDKVCRLWWTMRTCAMSECPL